MKKSKVHVVFLFLLAVVRIHAQDTLNKKEEKVYYNFVVNVVPDNYNKLLNGIVNIAKGNHEAAQIGIVNYNQKNLTGFQLACVNIVGGNKNGPQVGFVNTCFDTLKALQIGLLNINKVNKGFQVGVINYSDTSAGGIRTAFLSIYRRGGYQALEYYVSEMFPVNISFKIGLSKNHNALHLSYDNASKVFYFGGGFGFFKQISNKWFFNPELALHNSLGNKPIHILSFAPKFTYELCRKVFFSIGPACSYMWNPYGRKPLKHTSEEKEGLYTPLSDTFYATSKNGRNRIVVGFRVGLRFNFTDVVKKTKTS